MRVTGNQIIDAAAAATSRGQTRVADVQAEVTSGLRVERPSDDPTAWLAAHRALMRRSLLEGAGAAVKAGRERLEQTDGALAAIGDAVAQVRTLAVQGASASYNANDRAELGVQVRALFETALAAANTRATDGEFLLAGSASQVAPFGPTGAYAGDALTRAVPTSDAATALSTVAGSELTAARGVDVLPLLDRIATALAGNDTAALASGLDELDAAIKQVSLARTRTGSTTSVLDATVTAHDQLEDHLTQTVARHIEVDTVAAASELAKATQALEVSRAVTSHVIALLEPVR